MGIKIGRRQIFKNFLRIIFLKIFPRKYLFVFKLFSFDKISIFPRYHYLRQKISPNKWKIRGIFFTPIFFYTKNFSFFSPIVLHPNFCIFYTKNFTFFTPKYLYFLDQNFLNFFTINFEI